MQLHHFRFNALHRAAIAMLATLFALICFFRASQAAAVEAPGEFGHIPLDVQGTAFQEAVWRELQRIPPGETRSYAQIAAAVGRPNAVRAAGSANGANNVAVLIPCHRVIRTDGSLGGYAYGLAIKQELLNRERGPQRDAV